MNSLFLKRNPLLFQGEHKCKNSKTYFEGWYFKHNSKEHSISFIPGIHIKEGKKYAFIQVITKEKSYYIPYDFSEFSFKHTPFSITIGKNYFSFTSIKIDIDNADLTIQGSLHYSNPTPLESHPFSPNIMGPFSFLPFMECNHGIQSMKHNIHGNLMINNRSYSYGDGVGYIEKDWGSSFPTSYIWSQSNNFVNKSASFFLSVATIPLSLFSFTGFICVLQIHGKEYRFATYNNSKIISYNIANNNFNIVLKKNNLILQVQSQSENSLSLLAPKNGSMIHPILESIDSNVEITLWKNGIEIFSEDGNHAGLEIVMENETTL